MNEHRPDVSVIVPVYNVEGYVEECLDSLARQTHESFEVIVVDDASTDGSCARARARIGGDERFRLIERAENGGLSAARNTGLDVASGEYVVFLDSDDALAEDALGKLVERARRQDLDDLYFSGTSFYEDESLRGKVVEDYASRDPYRGVTTGQDLFVFFEGRGQFFTQAALRMVRRDLLERERIRFKEGILHEDILFTFLTLVASERSSFLDEPLYLRRIRADSIMGRTPTTDNIDGHFVSIEGIRAWLYDHADDVDGEFALAVSRQLATWCQWCAAVWQRDIGKRERKRYLEGLDPCLRLEFYRDVLAAGMRAEDVRAEYERSATWRVGNAALALPRAVRRLARPR